MSLARPDRPSKKPQRLSPEQFVGLEQESERRPFEGFIKRELTEPRLQGMLRNLESARSREDWEEFCPMANTLILLAPERVPKEVFDEKIFERLISLQEVDINVDTIRTLETFYPHRHGDIEKALQPTVDLMVMQGLKAIQELAQREIETGVTGVYTRAFALIFLAPERKSEFLLTKELFSDMRSTVERNNRSFDVRQRFASIKKAAQVAILQPEYKATLPIDAQLEQDACHALISYDAEGAFEESAQLFERIAFYAAREVRIPRRGIVEIVSPETHISSFPPLPKQNEY